MSTSSPSPQVAEHGCAQPVDLLISGGAVVTMDGALTVHEDGAVAVQNGRIVWVGPGKDAGTRFRAGQTIDARGQIVMPGLVDAHFHTAQQLLRGYMFALARKGGMKSPIWQHYYIPFESILEPEDIYLSGLLSYVNMLSVGTTCFADAGGPHPDEMGRAAMEVGIRGFVALSTIDSPNGIPANMHLSADRALRANVDLVRRWCGNERVQATLALRQIIVCSPGLIQDMAKEARTLGVKIHTHLCEGTYEIDYALARHGMRPTEYLAHLGVLDTHLHCAHTVLLSPPELDTFIGSGASSCHCAFNNYMLGAPRLEEMWRRGTPVGLGTDGAAAWGTLDIFQVAHQARLGQQFLAGTPWHHRHPMTGEDVMGIATRGGAAALSLAADIGSIEVGKKADLILVDAQSWDQRPAPDALFCATHSVTGKDVRTVLIDGEVVLSERRPTRVDVERLDALLLSRLPRIMERFAQAIR